MAGGTKRASVSDEPDSPPRERTRSAEELARDARAGSADAFAALVERFRPRLRAYLGRGAGQEAEDLTQETFLRAYQKLRQYDPSRPFAPWLYAVARSVAATQARRLRPAAAMPDAGLADAAPQPGDAVAADEQRAELWRLARRLLTEDQYRALWLRYARDAEVAEIAREMRRSRPAVRVLLHRGRKRLIDATRAAGTA